MAPTRGHSLGDHGQRIHAAANTCGPRTWAMAGMAGAMADTGFAGGCRSGRCGTSVGPPRLSPAGVAATSSGPDDHEGFQRPDPGGPRSAPEVAWSRLVHSRGNSELCVRSPRDRSGHQCATSDCQNRFGCRAAGCNTDSPGANPGREVGAAGLPPRRALGYCLDGAWCAVMSGA